MWMRSCAWIWNCSAKVGWPFLRLSRRWATTPSNTGQRLVRHSGLGCLRGRWEAGFELVSLAERWARLRALQQRRVRPVAPVARWMASELREFKIGAPLRRAAHFSVPVQ